ncbi:D-2-hydroxyacid dehydrogenase [Marinomonas dokdonensis]|uniref:D-2-hydroxyacid dehydrogenase n=1 Tax=Marinomonas dokdonensis TaxID=328224 RepID=UPI00405597C8
MKAVFLDRETFPNYIDIALPDQISEFVEYPISTQEEAIERIKDADIVLTNKAILNAEAIAQATSLKLVQVMATGTNNVDHQACKEANVTVQNVEGYSVDSVPEHTFSLLLALRRNLLSYVSDVKAGKWSESKHFCFLDYPIKDIAGTTMAIFGKGTLGTHVAKIAQAFGMKVVFADHKDAETVRDGYISFEEAISLADAISLNCPLTPTTQNLISTAEFKQMKPSCLLLNIGRGGLVDEQALVTALKNQLIAGAAFDVSQTEPMPANSPLNELLDMPNFLLTPHVAWASDDAMRKLVGIAQDKMSTFIENLS